MSEIEYNVQHNEEEIDLRELILALWKNKYIIISITLIAAILTGLYSFFLLSPVYHTKLNIIISMPEKYMTRYGEYTLPITTNDQYINLITTNGVLVNTISDMGYDAGTITVENLRDRIAIGKIDTAIAQNSFDITVSADNSAESLKLAEVLYDNYIEFLDVMTKERVVNSYISSFSIALKSLEFSVQSVKDILKKNEELLAQTPQTINQKEAMQEIQDTHDYIVFENIISENYIKIESDIISNKQSINSNENAMKVYNEYLEELNNEKAVVAEYYKTGKADKLESSIVNVVETSIYLPSPPVAPNQKTSPSNARNVAIGIVIGGMLGVMVVFLKEFLLKKD